MCKAHIKISHSKAIKLSMVYCPFENIVFVFWQMEDGHTIFDYNVGLNDIVQLLVRQNVTPATTIKSKDKEAELSDSDSGCGSTQSESDKSSTHGEVEGQTACTSAQTNTAELIDPGFGSYKVSLKNDSWSLINNIKMC